ncbi:MAG: M48 family metallopeptidase [bacterium]|nr:M48 family metallopeptidase [bacterium]
MRFFLDKLKLHKLLVSALAATVVMVSVFTNAAQARGLIRDTETENLIREYARPIFKAAGLFGQNIKIHIVSDRAFNAFVVDGQNMFIHIGAITNSKTPNQLIGVIAHETGHITGGHLARFRSQLKKAQSASLMLQILSIAAMVGGAAAGSEFGQAGGAALMGGNTIIQKNILAYRRVEESAADRAAMTFLNGTHQSAKGMLKTFEFFADQGLASLRQADPYLQSHPMPRQRLAQLRDIARRSPYFNVLDRPSLQRRHEMVKAKLIGFLENPAIVFNLYNRRNTSLPARYARAIASYRRGGLKSFLPKINALISEHSDNPFFHEIKGQFLFEGGRPTTAIKPLRKAVSLAPDAPLIRVLLAQALLASNDDLLVDEAIRHLRKGLGREDKYALGYRQLANAYARKRKISRAEIASAQAYFYEGRLKLAKQQAKRAKKKLKNGSAQWLIADDILRFQQPKR